MGGSSEVVGAFDTSCISSSRLSFLSTSCADSSLLGSAMSPVAVAGSLVLRSSMSVSCTSSSVFFFDGGDKPGRLELLRLPLGSAVGAMFRLSSQTN